ncbi:MAG: M15 family metallopeptidase, partial [Actinomycetota bacterium]
MRRLLISLLCAFALAAGCTPSTFEKTAAPKAPVPMVIWSSRDLPAGLDARVAEIDGVRWVSRVTVGMVNLIGVKHATNPLPHRRRGGILPISIAAMDPAAKATDALSAALAAGKAALSEKAAAIRGMEAGSALTIEAAGKRRTFQIGAIVGEDDARGRELIVPLASAADLGLTAPRALVTSVEGDLADAALSSMKAITQGVLARIHTGDQVVPDPTEGPILSFAEIKEIFGEFIFKPRNKGLFVSVDRPWIDANIVETDIPLLGILKCNKRLLPQLVGAMHELQARGLAGLVRSGDGCWSPRMQVGNSYALSRHAYGIAVDINAATNLYGETPRQDPRLVEVMERWGFTWGGRWLVPDGMHFEFVR